MDSLFCAVCFVLDDVELLKAVTIINGQAVCAKHMTAAILGLDGKRDIVSIVDRAKELNDGA